MNPEELARRLLATFLDELDEQVRAMNAELLALEQDPADVEHLRALFRVAHNVKGAARVAGVPLVEQAFHSLESLFATVRDGGRTLSPADFELLFAAADAIADAGHRIRRDESLDTGPLAGVVTRIQIALVTPAPAPIPAAPAAPSATPAAVIAPPVRPAPVIDVPEQLAPESAQAEQVSRLPEVSEPVAEPVRVEPARLDELLATAGELLVASSRVQERLTDLNAVRDLVRGLASDTAGGNVATISTLQQDLERFSRASAGDARAFARITEQLGATVRNLRMRAFAEACHALPRAVRDVAAQAHKNVKLDIIGQDVRSDRAVVDALREPLLHLVRNAIDHGIETPDERVAAGKPAEGTIWIAAALQGGRLVITVRDDGRGVDLEALRRAFKRHGRAAPTNDRDLALTLLTGGISTREQATAISGRGVGLDAVRATMERIGGSVDLQWEPGGGTTFVLECAPTPTTIRVLLFKLGEQVFAIPTTNVERLIRIRREDLRYAEGRALLLRDDTPLPVWLLAQVIGLSTANTLPDVAHALMLRAGSRRAVFVVDEFQSEQEVVIHPIRRAGATLTHITGGAMLSSGRLALVLSPGALLGALQSSQQSPSLASTRVERKRRILIADDSITTRTLEQSVLEAAGYEVTTASDGQDAWRKLQERGADLLVSDVEMPRMDGITLCETVRRSTNFPTLPVILVTGLESDEHRLRGLEAGADAYLGKSTFDQGTLLETIRQLLR